MTDARRLQVVLIAGYVLACLVMALAPVGDLLAAPAGVREVTVNASQFAFDPPVVRVNRGDRVILAVSATDVVHGLYLDGYDVNLRAVPGVSQQAEFVVDRAGKFRFHCSVSCGNLHPFMIGELVVAPNDLYWRAIGLTLLTVTATLLWLRLQPAPARADV